jgi:uncharacterized protein involved in outer membrane biogenesis
MPSQVRKPETASEGCSGRDVVRREDFRRVRRIAIALALVIALPSILLVALLIGLNPAIRTTIETLAADAVGVPAALEEVRVNIIGGIHLTRLAVGSPKEFREVRALRIGRIDAAVSVPSLFGRIVEIQDVLLSDPEITLEFDGKKSNWGVLMKQAVAKSRKPGDGDGDRNFIIHRLRITRAAVIVRTPGLAKGVALRLRDIELQEIGSAPGSAAPFSLVLATVVQALITGAIEEWTDIPGDLGDILGAESARTSEALGDSLIRARK